MLWIMVKERETKCEQVGVVSKWVLMMPQKNIVKVHMGKYFIYSSDKYKR